VLGFAEGNHLGEDLAMLGQKEIFRFQRLDGGIKRTVIEENRAKNGAFGVEVTREGTFESRIRSHNAQNLSENTVSLYIRCTCL